MVRPSEPVAERPEPSGRKVHHMPMPGALRQQPQERSRVAAWLIASRNCQRAIYHDNVCHSRLPQGLQLTLSYGFPQVGSPVVISECARSRRNAMGKEDPAIALYAPIHAQPPRSIHTEAIADDGPAPVCNDLS
jgi:hypothetical protein